MSCYRLILSKYWCKNIIKKLGYMSIYNVIKVVRKHFNYFETAKHLLLQLHWLQLPSFFNVNSVSHEIVNYFSLILLKYGFFFFHFVFISGLNILGSSWNVSGFGITWNWIFRFGSEITRIVQDFLLHTRFT